MNRKLDDCTIIKFFLIYLNLKKKEGISFSSEKYKILPYSQIHFRFWKTTTDWTIVKVQYTETSIKTKYVQRKDWVNLKFKFSDGVGNIKALTKPIKLSSSLIFLRRR
jgi:hypothetical protein